MRLDNYISDTGVVKRRTVAKELADGGHVKINGRRGKPGHKVKVDDIIEITGRHHVKIKVLRLPEGKSIPKEARSEYFEILAEEKSPGFEL
ncbi:MAG: RNA-binding S4 domain-containing protein [FCB group bacterium]|nr:RNA-binding S4 domain-containing protein [FCB group bacterium]